MDRSNVHFFESCQKCVPVMQGRLFGMVPGQVNQSMHVLLPALRAALRILGDAPARSLMTLAQRLGLPEADASELYFTRPELRLL